jgi:hypothetical protein
MADRLRYRTALEDMIAFNRLVFERNPGIQAGIRKLQLLAAFGAFGLSAALLLTASLSFMLTGVFSLALAAAAYLVTRRVFVNLLVRRILKAYKNGAGAAGLGACSLELAADGLRHRTPTLEETVPYASLQGIDIAGTYAFIRLNDLQAICVPALRVEEGDLQAFLKALRERLPA